MGTVMDGLAFGTGSAIAHRAVGAVFGGMGGGSSTPAEQQAAAPAAAPVSAASAPKGCEIHNQEFMRCLKENRVRLWVVCPSVLLCFAPFPQAVPSTLNHHAPPFTCLYRTTLLLARCSWTTIPSATRTQGCTKGVGGRLAFFICNKKEYFSGKSCRSLPHPRAAGAVKSGRQACLRSAAWNLQPFGPP
jgi:hypothetical protein